MPYRRIRNNSLRNVLIIGAGSGSDVAIALAEGAKHVDAVEIDPRIYAIGRRINPDHPYQDPRVSVHVDDGRAFLERTHDRYDLILFALPDSLALVSGQSSLRLESYLFTTQAMRSARSHLTPEGAFGMYNYYREDWLKDRYARTLADAYGYPPCIDAVGHSGWFALLTIGARPGNVVCATTWSAGARAAPAAVSDDYPFPYLRTPSIPPLYLWTVALILLVSLAAIRLAAGPLGSMRGYLDLFFMGAAFLLLETKSVVQFALLFGTTWFVNALVFFGILASVLLAIEVTSRTRLRAPWLAYAALFLSLLAAWTVDPDRLLQLDLPRASRPRPRSRLRRSSSQISSSRNAFATSVPRPPHSPQTCWEPCAAVCSSMRASSRVTVTSSRWWRCSTRWRSLLDCLAWNQRCAREPRKRR